MVRNDKFDSPHGMGLLLAGRGQSIDDSVGGSLVELSRRSKSIGGGLTNASHSCSSGLCKSEVK